MASPFKFLDAYGADDAKSFFGRDRETELLYRLLFKSDVVVVYGPSGTGKTSLIQSGLAGRFQESDWQPFFVRRGANLNRSLKRALRQGAETEIPKRAGLLTEVRSRYLDSLRPIYLIFDQFEELFILGSVVEQRRFIRNLAALIASDVSCKVILSLREDYLALLAPLEAAVPTLLEQRLRVEPMSHANLRKVIEGTLGKFAISLGSDAVPGAILGNLAEKPRGEVQLAYLQVYLDRLYRGAAPDPDGCRVFDEALVEKTGRLDDVLVTFLDEQTKAIQEAHPQLPDDAVQQVLEAHATLEGTKAPMTRAQLDEDRKLKPLKPALGAILDELQKARILRVVDGLSELSHDALAARIADRRSVAAKTLLRLEKIVRDQLAAWGDTGELLTPRELGFLRPYETELDLTPEEKAFVRRSRRAAGLRRGLQIGVSAVVVLIVAAALFIAGLRATEPAMAVKLARDQTYYRQYGLAQAIIAPALMRYPDDRDLLFERADIYVRIGKGDLAFKDYDAIRKRWGDSSEVLNALCWRQAVRAFNLKQANIDCDNALLKSDTVDSLGFVLLQRGKLTEALDVYEKALAARPPQGKERAKTLYGKGLTLMRLGRRTEGRAALAEARALYGDVDQTFDDVTRTPPPVLPTPQGDQ